VANAVAALSRTSNGCIVVDFGTATTFDCISSENAYLGGVICPGLRISLDALVTTAAKLPKVEIVRPKRTIGKTTEEAMQSGILFGYAAMVDGMITRLTKEMDEKTDILSTGGLSATVARETSTSMELVPDLTLDGLRIIWEKNV
jgi:type III pantothenate kinase